jgi:hypothetical protein
MSFRVNQATENLLFLFYLLTRVPKDSNCTYPATVRPYRLKTGSEKPCEISTLWVGGKNPASDDKMLVVEGEHLLGKVRTIPQMEYTILVKSGEVSILVLTRVARLLATSPRPFRTETVPFQARKASPLAR